MNTGPQSVNPVDTVKVLGRLKRDKIVKLRVSPEELYLLNEADKKLGFGNVSTTIRHLIKHFNDIDTAKQTLDLLRQSEELRQQAQQLMLNKP